jgi:hypothetical protein
MNIALWVMQPVLALALIAAGSMKVFAYEKYKAMSEKNGLTDLKQSTVSVECSRPLPRSRTNDATIRS